MSAEPRFAVGDPVRDRTLGRRGTVVEVLPQTRAERAAGVARRYLVAWAGASPGRSPMHESRIEPEIGGAPCSPPS